MGNLISLARGNQNPENAMQASNARYTQRLSLKAESTVGSVVTSPVRRIRGTILFYITYP